MDDETGGVNLQQCLRQQTEGETKLKSFKNNTMHINEMTHSIKSR